MKSLDLSRSFDKVLPFQISVAGADANKNVRYLCEFIRRRRLDA